ncbi:hypothetical protein ACFRQM_09250 [Streptomyces sp. NPDC056831]|uniref:hypothetical protein n=1 Tax=Streptomyces sp. NPDC056831 TaxID=3345954 RepID=UPI0036CDDB5D
MVQEQVALVLLLPTCAVMGVITYGLFFTKISRRVLGNAALAAIAAAVVELIYMKAEGVAIFGSIVFVLCAVMVGVINHVESKQKSQR